MQFSFPIQTVEAGTNNKILVKQDTDNEVLG